MEQDFGPTRSPKGQGYPAQHHRCRKQVINKMLLVVAGRIYVKGKAVIACCIILHCSCLKLTVITVLHIEPTV